MTLSYNQQQDLKRIGAQTTKTILERVIVYSVEGMKILFGLIKTFINQVTGR